MLPMSFADMDLGSVKQALGNIAKQLEELRGHL